MGGQGQRAVRRPMSILVEMLQWSGRDGMSLDYGGSGGMIEAKVAGKILIIKIRNQSLILA